MLNLRTFKWLGAIGAMLVLGAAAPVNAGHTSVSIRIGGGVPSCRTPVRHVRHVTPCDSPRYIRGCDQDVTYWSGHQRAPSRVVVIERRGFYGAGAAQVRRGRCR